MSVGDRQALAQPTITSPTIVRSGQKVSTVGMIGKLSIDVSDIDNDVTEIKAGWIMNVEMSAIYHSDLTDCFIIQGLNQITPGQPIKCSIDSTDYTGTIKIEDFSGIDTGNQPLTIQYTFDSAAAYSDGTITVKMYGSAAQYASGVNDFASESSVAYTHTAVPTPAYNDITISSFAFSSAPYPGESGTFEPDIDALPLSVNYLPATDDYLVIQFE